MKPTFCVLHDLPAEEESVFPLMQDIVRAAVRKRTSGDRLPAIATAIFYLFFGENLQRQNHPTKSDTMATLLPPPSKRQRTENAERARLQQEIQSIPENLGSIRVQFFDQATGSATGPAVSVPVADASVKNLETLLNTLQGNVGMQRGIVQHIQRLIGFCAAGRR